MESMNKSSFTIFWRFLAFFLSDFNLIKPNLMTKYNVKVTKKDYFY